MTKGAEIINSDVHESDKLTKSAVRTDTDKVEAQNLRSVRMFLNDSLRIKTCRGRLTVQIKIKVIAAIQIASTTTSFLSSRRDNAPTGTLISDLKTMDKERIRYAGKQSLSV